MISCGCVSDVNHSPPRKCAQQLCSWVGHRIFSHASFFVRTGFFIKWFARQVTICEQGFVRVASGGVRVRGLAAGFWGCQSCWGWPGCGIAVPNYEQFSLQPRAHVSVRNDRRCDRRVGLGPKVHAPTTRIVCNS